MTTWKRTTLRCGGNQVKNNNKRVNLKKDRGSESPLRKKSLRLRKGVFRSSGKGNVVWEPNGSRYTRAGGRRFQRKLPSLQLGGFGRTMDWGDGGQEGKAVDGREEKQVGFVRGT